MRSDQKGLFKEFSTLHSDNMYSLLKVERSIYKEYTHKNVDPKNIDKVYQIKADHYLNNGDVKLTDEQELEIATLLGSSILYDYDDDNFSDTLTRGVGTIGHVNVVRGRTTGDQKQKNTEANRRFLESNEEERKAELKKKPAEIAKALKELEDQFLALTLDAYEEEVKASYKKTELIRLEKIIQETLKTSEKDSNGVPIYPMGKTLYKDPRGGEYGFSTTREPKLKVKREE